MLTLLAKGVNLSVMAAYNRNDPPDERLGSVSARIYRLLADHPEGLDISQIRQLLNYRESQEHLNRRVRDLRKYYQVQGKHSGKRYIYILIGPKQGKVGDTGTISGKLRAQIYHLAKGRCQMCGRTVEKDAVRLQLDHKVPQAWGGLTTPDNLWAICETCNNGKRDYFASYNDKDLKKVIAIPSVHERIAKLLKMHIGKPVQSRLIEFIANATERQEDWQKRLRELRYPVIGLKIKVGKRKNPQGYIESTYMLEEWKAIPSNHKQLIRDWDNKKKRKELSSGSDFSNLD